MNTLLYYIRQYPELPPEDPDFILICPDTLPVLYYCYIEEAIKMYPATDLLIRRLPPLSIMEAYMTTNNLDAFLVSIYIHHTPTAIVLYYQGYSYTWDGAHILRGPNHNIVTHFKNRTKLLCLPN